jgi:hypothetical protein
MFELVRNARMIWSGVLDLADLLPEGSQRESVEAGRQIVRDTSRLTAAVRNIFNDENRSTALRSEVAFLAAHSDEVLGRWASVMLASEVYAEVGFVCKEGDTPQRVRAGDTVWIAPNERHWHGATSRTLMSHTTTTIGATEFHEAVTEADYGAANDTPTG